VVPSTSHDSSQAIENAEAVAIFLTYMALMLSVNLNDLSLTAFADKTIF